MDRLAQLKLALLDRLGAGFWNALTWLGEADLLLPLSVVVFLLLWRARRAEDAWGWAAAVLGCAIAVGAAKLAVGDFRWAVAGHVFHSKGFPSGHVAIATVFWGGLALLTARRWSPLLLVPVPLVALAVLVLWWHHTLDILAGALIGTAALAPLLLRAPRRSPRSAS
jgi:membrane-associated phospholipid phosphatase